eukprot:TRINITY_DN1988_c0_g1_i1.p1 TRINITY_DN1988_c0_g1~~TRINITY_DN1988_c0_g1_i1.p1  ORF type:complete len:422 (+),score=88.70 TRINITY_DN1988_c0_g1_i1:30-1268(+)
MAATAALGVVKQIQSLADGPPTPEMRDCLGQVVSSLLFFLEHPDCRVRIQAARTLAKLSSGYPEDFASLDLARARTALKRCQDAEDQSGENFEEFQELLASLLGEQATSSPSREKRSSDGLFRSPDRGAPEKRGQVVLKDRGAPEKRGQVVLKVSEQTDGKAQGALLEKIVALDGVVSVTFEGDYVIVSTRSVTVAADASFLADLLSAVKAQGIEGVSLVRTSAANGSGYPAYADGDRGSGYPAYADGDRGSGYPAYADGDRGSGYPAYADGDRGGASSSQSLPSKASGSAEPQAASTQAREADEYEDEAEPAYLDDEDDEVDVPRGGRSGPAAAGAGAPSSSSSGPGPVNGVPQWTFFSQNNWMNGRRVLEYDDDPSIAARLAKKKKEEQQRKEEEKSRLGRLSSWFAGRR